MNSFANIADSPGASIKRPRSGDNALVQDETKRLKSPQVRLVGYFITSRSRFPELTNGSSNSTAPSSK